MTVQKMKFWEAMKAVMEGRSVKMLHWGSGECVWLDRGFFIMTNESGKLERNEIRGCIAIPYIPNRYEMVAEIWIED